MTQMFTLDQANNALVFVYGVTRDVQKQWLEIKAISESGDMPSEQELNQRYKKLQKCFDELKQVGCVCRDPENGIVDFPSNRGLEPVFLCWKLGEDEVSHWHSLKDMCHNHSPIDEAFIETNNGTTDLITSVQ